METKHGLNCNQCGGAYESKRSTSKYCGAKCRKLAFQKDKVSVPENGKDAKSENGKVSVPSNGQTAKGLTLDKIVEIKDRLISESVEVDGLHVLNLLTPAMLDTLPVGVTRPTGQPNERTKAMTGESLNRRLIGVKSWQGGPEYAEVIYRLSTNQTEGMNLPTWARA